MNGDGTNDTQIVTGVGQVWSPSWSPDGKQIAFVAEDTDPVTQNNYNIYTTDSGDLNSNTTLKASLGENTTYDGFDIAWSSVSGSDEILYEKWAANLPTPRYQVFSTDGVIAAAASEGSTLGINGELIDWAEDPEWSPDGQKIVYIERLSGNGYVTTINQDGTGKSTYINTGGNYFNDVVRPKHPQWAPDGSNRIVYAQGGELFALDLNPPNNITQITNAGLNAAQPTWSSDGLQIAFEGDYQGVRAIYTNNAGGGNPIRLRSNGMAPDRYGPAGQVATPIPCSSIALTDYATIFMFGDQGSALYIAQQVVNPFIQHNDIGQGNVISRVELDRIREVVHLNTNQRWYAFGNYLDTRVSDPFSMGNATIYTNNVAEAGGTYLLTLYGLSGCTNLDSASMAVETFVFDPDNTVDTTNLVIEYPPNPVQNMDGSVNPHPLDTSLGNLSLLNHYVGGKADGTIVALSEYNTTAALCPTGDTTCENRVYTRMVLEGNNRLNELIYWNSASPRVPPLFFKLLLMQESALVPALTPNSSGAAGIAQFVAHSGAQQMVNDGRAPAGITEGYQYLAYLDGVTGTTAYPANSDGTLTGALPNDPCMQLSVLRSAGLNTVRFPLSEENCVDFDETQRAISDSAYYLSKIVNYLITITQYPQVSAKWQATPASTQNEILWLLAGAGYNWGQGRAGDALYNGAVYASNQGIPLTIDVICIYIDDNQPKQYIRNIRYGIPGAGPTGSCSLN